MYVRRVPYTLRFTSWRSGLSLGFSPDPTSANEFLIPSGNRFGYSEHQGRVLNLIFSLGHSVIFSLSVCRSFFFSVRISFLFVRISRSLLSRSDTVVESGTTKGKSKLEIGRARRIIEDSEKNSSGLTPYKGALTFLTRFCLFYVYFNGRVSNRISSRSQMTYRPSITGD